MILRQAYLIAEEAKRAMAGKPKAEADAIRAKAIMEFMRILEANQSKRQP